MRVQEHAGPCPCPRPDSTAQKHGEHGKPCVVQLHLMKLQEGKSWEVGPVQLTRLRSKPEPNLTFAYVKRPKPCRVSEASLQEMATAIPLPKTCGLDSRA